MISRFLANVSSCSVARRRGHGYALQTRLIGGLCGAGMALTAIGVSAQQQGSAPNITRQVQTQVSVPLPSLHPIVERVMPAVVNISVVMSEQDIAQNDESEDGSGFPSSPFDELLRRYFEQQGTPNATPQRPRPRAGRAVALGSGFIIDPAGGVVTNNHVVGSADKVTVIFQDNSKHPARIVGRDEQTDVALLKIDADRPLPFVEWSDSDAAQVGDWVVAVGNPFGLGGTVTAGIVSARGRNIEAGPYDDFLQIDASINRGNSGGPTFNLTGQVIGINTAIYSPSGGSVGIGFAVPSSLAQNVVAQLKEKGRVTRGWLGVQIQPVTPEIARSLGLSPDSPKGAIVADVTPGSPAAKAGVNAGDVITGFAGKEVRDAHDLPRLVAETPVGRKVDLNILRDGREQPLQVVVDELKGPQTAAANRNDQARPKQRTSALGLQLSPLSDEAREKAGVPKHVSGVLVAGVAPDSPAAGMVEPGDVIVSINRQPVTEPSTAAAQLQEAAAQKKALLLVNRHGTNRFIGLPFGSNRG